MPLIAITGGIASGKSSFTRLFAGLLGAGVQDTDLIARRLLAEDADVAREVRAAFGPAPFDAAGQIDRAVLRKEVFASAARRRVLEGILHPRVRVAWTGWAREQLQIAPDAILLVEIPLLYETEAAPLFDQAVVVGCPPETQVRRLTAQRGLSHETACQIIASQWPLTEKIRRGDRLIWNDGSPASLQAQTELCAKYYQEAFGRPR